jgi:hypothetical protein
MVYWNLPDKDTKLSFSNCIYCFSQLFSPYFWLSIFSILVVFFIDSLYLMLTLSNNGTILFFGFATTLLGISGIIMIYQYFCTNPQERKEQKEVLDNYFVHQVYHFIHTILIISLINIILFSVMNKLEHRNVWIVIMCIFILSKIILYFLKKNKEKECENTPNSV